MARKAVVERVKRVGFSKPSEGGKRAKNRKRNKAARKARRINRG